MVLPLLVRCGRSMSIGNRRRGMPMRNFRCARAGHRWRTIVLGARVDSPVPEEHRDQPELDYGRQRSEPTSASH